MQRSLILALGALFLLLPMRAARAHEIVAHSHDVLIGLDVIDRASGVPLAQYPGRGDLWVEGAPGQRYAIRLQNRSSERMLVVLSVDGINAVSGETAAADQAGYVLDPWQTAEITGWRKSLSEVAAFEFAQLPDSYAARTGRPDNIGVIGVAAFREKRRLPPPDVAMRAPAQDKAGASMERERSAAPAAPSPSLGTAHGARESSWVNRTHFERASSRPDQVRSLRYDRRENLIALGVLPTPRPWPHRPDPFPGGFVPDP